MEEKALREYLISAIMELSDAQKQEVLDFLEDYRRKKGALDNGESKD